MPTEIQMLETIELGNIDQAQHSVIWLHGLGADGNDFVSLVPELKLPSLERIHFVFPHAPVRPVTLNGGMPMRAWFDIYDLNRSGPVDEAGIQEAVASIHQLIDHEIAQGIKPEHIILTGFSQGGSIALLSGITYPKRLAGLVGLSTFLRQPQNFEDWRQPQNQDTPIFLAHGSQDPIITLQYGEDTAALLKNLGYTTEFHTYPMAHSVCFEEIKDLSRWLQQHLK